MNKKNKMGLTWFGQSVATSTQCPNGDVLSFIEVDFGTVIRAMKVGLSQPL